MKLTIEALRGTWRAQHESRTYFDETLEGLLLQMAPGAPDGKLWAAAEVLGGILGAEVVNVDPDYSVLFAELFAAEEPHPDEYPRGA